AIGLALPARVRIEHGARHIDQEQECAWIAAADFGFVGHAASLRRLGRTVPCGRKSSRAGRFWSPEFSGQGAPSPIGPGRRRPVVRFHPRRRGLTAPGPPRKLPAVPMPAPASTLAPAVETTALTRTFRAPRRAARGAPDPPAAGARGGEVRALAGVDVRIERGEIFGLLGPNGAGKTTFIKILTTLLFPTSGEGRVAGHDVVRAAGEVRRRISLISGGESSGYGSLMVRECLWMYSQFYGIPAAIAWPRVDELL